MKWTSCIRSIPLRKRKYRIVYVLVRVTSSSSFILTENIGNVVEKNMKTKETKEGSNQYRLVSMLLVF